MSARPQTPRPRRNRALRGWLSPVLKPVVPPHVFDFWASRVHPLWTMERPLAQLVERRKASRDAVTLVLRPNRHWAGFRPGQHINLGAEIDGTRVTRSYSLSAPPRADGLIEITVKTMPGGKVSPHLFELARKGEVFELGPAFGDMTLPERPKGGTLPEAWLFLAGGSGITPLMAMVRALAEQGMPVPLTLVCWARRREEQCFVDELRALAKAYANFNVHFVLTREPAEGGDEHEGRISADLVSSLVGDHADDLAARQVMACGPGGFVETARSLLDGRVRSFQSEAFTLPEVPTVDEGEVELTLARRGRVLRVPRGQSLLKALEAQGIKPPSGCRMGICNTCACGKSSGSVRHLPSGALVHESNQALKLCIHSAATDLTIDL